MSVTLTWTCPNGHENQEVVNSHAAKDFKGLVCGQCGARGEEKPLPEYPAKLTWLEDHPQSMGDKTFTLSFEGLGRPALATVCEVQGWGQQKEFRGSILDAHGAEVTESDDFSTREEAIYYVEVKLGLEKFKLPKAPTEDLALKVVAELLPVIKKLEAEDADPDDVENAIDAWFDELRGMARGKT